MDKIRFMMAAALLLLLATCTKKEEDKSVTLAADCGCAAYYDSLVVIPNAFTPNDDGNNDVFRPFFFKIPDTYSVTIKNPKDGQVVFTATEVADGWNGKTGGQVHNGRFQVSMAWTLGGKSYSRDICVSVVSCVINANCRFLDQFMSGSGFTASTMEQNCK